MPVRIIQSPKRIEAHGQPPKTIEEFVGRVNSGDAALSIARMVSPSGWSEPGQTPEFDEYTVVLRGALQVFREIDAVDALIDQLSHEARECVGDRRERRLDRVGIGVDVSFSNFALRSTSFSARSW